MLCPSLPLAFSTTNTTPPRLSPRRTSLLPSLTSSSPLVKTLMYTLGILDALAIAQHITTIFYSFLSIEMYYSIIWSKKPLITTLVDILDVFGALTKSIKDILRVFFNLALYLLNPIAHVKLGTVSPLFMLVVKDGWRGAI
ncbi:hypothetical protein C4D60_Mb05t23900 [Musa balbisiana]|uniref:Uncharacterized protein n=1 Tax=Musa balbisiana TaxID=52838 RepID=A0A4S8JYF3_MUSBA|nr:hypothetical protein C4D60_Mb05t23900 [Musa balbisiana]